MGGGPPRLASYREQACYEQSQSNRVEPASGRFVSSVGDREVFLNLQVSWFHCHSASAAETSSELTLCGRQRLRATVIVQCEGSKPPKQIRARTKMTSCWAGYIPGSRRGSGKPIQA